MSGMLIVNVIEAKDLESKETFGKNDAFCELHFGRQSYRTRVHKAAGANARWNEQFSLNMSSQVSLLTVLVFDEDPVSNDLIGRCDLDLDPFKAHVSAPHDGWYQVKNSSGKNAGSIRLSIQFVPSSGSTEQKSQAPTATAAAPAAAASQHPGAHPPQAQGYPPQMQGYPPQAQGYPPQAQGYPPQMQGYPPQAQGYPPQVQGHPPQMQGYPPQAQGYPPQAQGYPPQMQGYPPQAQGYPPQAQGYPPQMQGYPPQMQGFPPQGYPAQMQGQMPLPGALPQGMSHPMADPNCSKCHGAGVKPKKGKVCKCVTGRLKSKHK